MKESTFQNRLSKSWGIFKESFGKLGLPYFVVMIIVSIPNIFFPQEYILWITGNLFFGITIPLAVFCVSFALLLAYRKCIIHTYLIKDKDMKFGDGIRYVMSNIKGISYIYWRVFVRILPAFGLTFLFMIGGILLLVLLDADPSKTSLIMAVMLVAYIPVIKRMVALAFVSANGLWHNEYSRDSVAIVEKATHGIFWEVLKNYLLVMSIPLIIGGVIGWLSAQGYFLPLPVTIMVTFINLFIGVFAVIYMLVYYHDIILPRIDASAPSESPQPSI